MPAPATALLLRRDHRALGNCDNCERGVPAEDQATAGDGESVVEHREWGKGSVLRIESNRAYIFFASVGYRAVDLDIAEENDLLQWGEP